MKKKIAVIGLGGIAQSVHLPVLTRLHDRAEIAALVDLSAKRVADIRASYGTGIQGFTSVDDLLQARQNGLEIDGALLATAGSHARDAARLTEAGVPVLVEKPLGYSHPELDQISHQESMRIGYMKEYDPAARVAREELSGLQIRAIEVEVLHPADQAQLAFANLRSATSDVDRQILDQANEPLQSALISVLGEDIYREHQGDLDRLYPNVILGSIVHDIALLRYLVGGIGTVDSACHYGPEFPGSLAFSGELAQVDAPWFLNWHFIADYPRYRETITIHHETGTLQLVFDVPYLLNVATELNTWGREGSLGVNRRQRTWPQAEAFETEWREFLDLIDGEAHPGSSLPEARLDLDVAGRMLAKLSQSKGIDLEGAQP